MALDKGKITKVHRGDAFLVKPILTARNIDPTKLYAKYTKGKNRWYGREHLNKIINGKRPIPIALAKDIAEQYKFKWTEFYEVDENRVKAIDATPDKQHDLLINFTPGGDKFYCPSEYIDSHWATFNVDDLPTYFGNQTKAVHLYMKEGLPLNSTSVDECRNHPILVKTKRKEFYQGMLHAFNTPIGEKYPVLYLSDLHNTRYASFRQNEVLTIHVCDLVMPRPQWFMD